MNEISVVVNQEPGKISWNFAGMNVEQWGNTCLIVRELLNGATVDECMAAFDKLQEEVLNK